MLSTPPATMTSAWPSMTRSAARAMACSPDEQKRFTVNPGTDVGQARQHRGDAGNVEPLLALGHGAAQNDVVDHVRRHARRPIDDFFDHQRGQVVGPHVLQCALGGLVRWVFSTPATITASRIAVTLLNFAAVYPS